MNEVILFIIFGIVVFGGYFLLRRVPKPTVNYIRILMTFVILALVWLDWDERNKAPQYILTALAVSRLLKEFFEVRKFQASKSTKS